MFRRFFCLVMLIVLLLPLVVVLSGCDEMSDAAHGAKGTASLQSRREHRNTDAINVIDDMPKSGK